MKELSIMAEGIQLSLTRTLFNKAKGYDDVIDFTLGDPDIQPAQRIKDAGCDAIQKGLTRYSHNAGLIELRCAISDYYARKESLTYDPASEIIVSVGAMEGLYLSILAITNPGDEFIIPAPYYVNYGQMVHMCGGVPVLIDEVCEEPLSFSVESIEKAITDKTKAIIINTPSNPSGKLIPWNKIERIAEIAKKYDLYVISDEVYKCLIYDGTEFKSIVSIDGMRERVIITNSLSKEFCMTGWRVGYVIANPHIVANMTRMQENICACAPLPSQYAAIEALSGKDDYGIEMRKVFLERRNALVSGIKRIPQLSCSAPEATFYLMVDVSRTGLKSYDFACKLLEEAHVAVVPGITYGHVCDDYVRIAFTISIDKINQGVERIAEFMKQYS